MAVDVFSENFVGIHSPRFSFSHDLEENEGTNPINGSSCRLDHSLVDSAFDFAFNVDSSTTFQSSTADQLFSGGKILPTPIKKEEIKRVNQQKPVAPCLHPHLTAEAEPRKKSLKEFLEDSSEEEEPNTASAAKSFWKFRRSNSLNCDRNQRKGLIGSWNVLSRSGSTGKYLEKILEEGEEKPKNNPKFFWKFSRSNSFSDQNVISGNAAVNKGLIGSSKTLRRSQSTSYDPHFPNSESMPFRRSNSTGSAPNHIWGNAKSTQKGQAKSCRAYSFGNYYNNNSVKISPLLNLPSPYISRVSVDLFGFRSLFCNGTKDRKKKK